MGRSKKDQSQLSRRTVIQSGSASLLSLYLGSCAAENRNRRSAETDGNSLKLAQNDDKNRRFLIVLTASGGASIIDGPMAISQAEVTAAGSDASTLNCFADSQLTSIEGTPFRAPKINASIGALGGFKVNVDQADFVRRHMLDMTVVTTEGTSVNHGVAQRRSITGNDAWNGRTLQEAVAAHYGKGLPISNLNLGAGGFSVPGIDPGVPDFAKQMTVANPIYWPLGLHSHHGLDMDIDSSLLSAARQFRNDTLEGESNFLRTFGNDPAVQRWLADRNRRLTTFEKRELAKKLYWYPQATSSLAPNPEAEALRALFPNFERDNFDAQAILAYLAITEGVSCAVTLGPDSAASASDQGVSDFYNPPIAFDFSHTDHRGTQAMMWNRVLTVADKLIQLLKAKEYNQGQSYWDRTMIYVATDFGRSRARSNGNEVFSSGHNLNNGVLIVSPFSRGNTVLGGVDASTGLTYGFDLTTGAPQPGRRTSEKELYAGILATMGVEAKGSGLPRVAAMKR